MPDKTLQAPLTGEETARLQTLLLELLAEQVKQYTKGESTSVPANLARELMASLVLTLGLPPLALTLTDAHRAALRHTKASPLHEAAERLAKEFDMDAPTLHAVARTLAARIPQGHLENVFL